MVELKIQDYSKNKNIFSDVESTLKNILPQNAQIYHVGSTAIPDMCGKNIIDILVGANNENEFEEFKQKISSLGFFASQNSRSEIYQFFASKQGETADGDIHIHLCITNTERYDEFLLLKNYLLSNKLEAINYSNHKKELINLGINDRKQYRETKSKYVSKLIKRAKDFFKYKRS